MWIPSSRDSLNRFTIFHPSFQQKQKNTATRTTAECEEENSVAGIVVDTVDGFQGSERDLIFLSLCRTEQHGFLADRRRGNVALTRARKGLVVFGSGKLLRGEALVPGKRCPKNRQAPFWRSWVEWVARNNAIVDAKKLRGFLDPETSYELMFSSSGSGGRTCCQRFQLHVPWPEEEELYAAAGAMAGGQQAADGQRQGDFLSRMLERRNLGLRRAADHDSVKWVIVDGGNLLHYRRRSGAVGPHVSASLAATALPNEAAREFDADNLVVAVRALRRSCPRAKVRICIFDCKWREMEGSKAGEELLRMVDHKHGGKSSSGGKKNVRIHLVPRGKDVDEACLRLCQRKLEAGAGRGGPPASASKEVVVASEETAEQSVMILTNDRFLDHRGGAKWAAGRDFGGRRGLPFEEVLGPYEISEDGVLTFERWVRAVV